jgi:hypothetical protein
MVQKPLDFGDATAKHKSLPCTFEKIKHYFMNSEEPSTQRKVRCTTSFHDQPDAAYSYSTFASDSEDEQASLHSSLGSSIESASRKSTLGLLQTDVICARDRQAHKLVGNRRYQELIYANRDVYQKATVREEKSKITKHVIQTVKDYGGRFVKYDKETGSWIEIDATAEHPKVSHALRSSKERPKKNQKRKPQAVKQ